MGITAISGGNVQITIESETQAGGERVRHSDPQTQANIGGVSDTAAANWSAASSLNGLLRLLGSIIGYASDAASSTGSLMSALRQFQFDGSGNLKTTGSGGSGGGTQYADGASSATPTGTVALAKKSGGTVAGLQLDANGYLQTSVSNFYAECSSGSAIAVSTSSTAILTVDVRNFRRLNLQIQNTGATALSGFTVSGRYNSGLGGFYNPRASSTADFTTSRALQTGNSTAFVYDASGDLTALGGGASGWVELNVERYESIKISAQVASGSSTVRVDGVAKTI